MKQTSKEAAISKINNLNQESFEKIASQVTSSKWVYLGSNSKDSGSDVFWMRFHNGYFEIITSTTYGDEEQYYLVEETSLDLASLKKHASSVIDSGDCLLNNQLDASNEKELSEIIHNIAHSYPGLYKEDSTTLTNPDLREEASQREMAMGEDLINKIFAEIASNYDIPFN